MSELMTSETGRVLWLLAPWVLWLLLSAVWALIAVFVFAPDRRLRAALLGSCVLACVLSLWPPSPWLQGVRCTLRVDLEEGLAARRDDALGEVLDVAEAQGVPLKQVRVIDVGALAVETREAEQARGMVEAVAQRLGTAWEVAASEPGTLRVRVKPAEGERLRAEVVQDTIRTLERRLRALGVASQVASGAEVGQIDLDLTDVSPTPIEGLKRVLTKRGRLRLHRVEAEAATREALLESQGGELPATTEVLTGSGDEPGSPIHYLVQRRAVITGRDVKNARVGVDSLSQPAVHFSLTPRAASRFEDWTSRNIGQRVAIVMDGEVVTAPRIQGRIGGEGQITGRFTAEEAQELAQVLRAGELPAPVRFLSENQASTWSIKARAELSRAGVVALVALAVAGLLVLLVRRAGLVGGLILLVAGPLAVLAVMVVVQRTLTVAGVAMGFLSFGLLADLLWARLRR